MNTKKRHLEILAVAIVALEDAGGVEVVDALPQEKRLPSLKIMSHYVQSETNCAMQIAKNAVAKAMRRARFKIMQERDPDNWGGARTPAPGKRLGPAPLPEDQKRQPVSTRLSPDVIDVNGETAGSKELAQAIAEVFELAGWGRVVDEALVRMVEGDRWLKAKLAGMGITLKKR
jgi:hypothetical protein